MLWRLSSCLLYHTSKDRATERRECEVGMGYHLYNPKDRQASWAAPEPRESTRTDCVLQSSDGCGLLLWDFWHSEWWQKILLIVLCHPSYGTWWLCWDRVTADSIIILTTHSDTGGERGFISVSLEPGNGGRGIIWLYGSSYFPSKCRKGLRANHSLLSALCSLSTAFWREHPFPFLTHAYPDKTPRTLDARVNPSIQQESGVASSRAL